MSGEALRAIPADRIERLLQLVGKACRDAALLCDERAYELWTAVRRELRDAPEVTPITPAPCVYESRSRDGVAHGGATEAWCRTHGFDCPNAGPIIDHGAYPVAIPPKATAENMRGRHPLVQRWIAGEMDAGGTIAALEQALAAASELRHALEESVKLQSHYASLLNMHDGGERMCFTVDLWIARLRSTAIGQSAIGPITWTEV